MRSFALMLATATMMSACLSGSGRAEVVGAHAFPRSEFAATYRWQVETDSGRWHGDALWVRFDDGESSMLRISLDETIPGVIRTVELIQRPDNVAFCELRETLLCADDVSSPGLLEVVAIVGPKDALVRDLAVREARVERGADGETVTCYSDHTRLREDCFTRDGIPTYSNNYVAPALLVAGSLTVDVGARGMIHGRVIDDRPASITAIEIHRDPAEIASARCGFQGLTPTDLCD